MNVNLIEKNTFKHEIENHTYLYSIAYKLICFFLISVAITWTNAPEDQYPILGEDYVVKCEVKADPNPTIDWLRNGDQVQLYLKDLKYL